MNPYQDKSNPWSSHSIIARWLKQMPASSLVVDVGAATGTLGRMCAGSGLALKGIEPNPDWAELARPFYQELFVGPVQTVPPGFYDGARCVVLADVLEHLPDPQAVLAELVGCQAPDCLFMISLPNVANLAVRFSLLFGRFEYADRGILDRTHLHFFTRRTLLAMLRDSGLHIQRMAVTPIPLDLVHPFFARQAFGRWLHGLLARLTGLFPTLLGYQFVVQAGKEQG